MTPSAAHWMQRTVELPARGAGFHLIGEYLVEQMPELRQFRIGLLHVFLLHTSASLTINENADPDVRDDLQMALEHICPESLPYTHTVEGPDDMPAHVKSSMLGCSLTVPIRDGRLVLGTWQGIYLCEHRRSRHRRTVVLTATGQLESGDS